MHSTETIGTKGWLLFRDALRKQEQAAAALAEALEGGTEDLEDRALALWLNLDMLASGLDVLIDSEVRS
jgi:hypothetical protein